RHRERLRPADLDEHTVDERDVGGPAIDSGPDLFERLHAPGVVPLLDAEQRLEPRADAWMPDDEQHSRPRDAPNSAFPCGLRIRSSAHAGGGRGRERAGVTACPTIRSN